MFATALMLSVVASIGDDLTPSDIRELSRVQLVEALDLLEELKPNYFVPLVFVSAGVSAGSVLAYASYTAWTTATASGNLFAVLLVGWLAAMVGFVAVGCGVVAIAGLALFTWRAHVRNQFAEVERQVRARLAETELHEVLTF